VYNNQEREFFSGEQNALVKAEEAIKRFAVKAIITFFAVKSKTFYREKQKKERDLSEDGKNHRDQKRKNHQRAFALERIRRDSSLGRSDAA